MYVQEGGRRAALPTGRIIPALRSSHAPSPIGRDAVFLVRLALDPVQEGAEVVKAAIGETATGDGVTAELAERRRLQVLPHLFVEISPVSGHKKTPCKNLSDFCMELADSSERCKRFPILSGFVQWILLLQAYFRKITCHI